MTTIDFKQNQSNEQIDFQPINFQPFKKDIKFVMGGATPDFSIIKSIGGFLTSSEQGLAKNISSAFGTQQITPRDVGETGKQIQQLVTEAHKFQIGDSRRTQLLQQAHQLAGINQRQITEQLSNIPSTKETSLNIAGVAGDILGVGTYGKSMKSFGLTKKAIPSAISLGAKGTEVISKEFEKLPGLAKKALVGKEGIKTLEQIGNEEAQKFAKGRTFSSVVDGVQKSIDSFVSKSKSTLQKVKQAIPKIPITPNKIAETVDSAIMKSIESNAAYRGISEKTASLFHSTEDLINSGLLNEEEARKVGGMIKSISNWTDNSARGVLNLKEQLSAFYKDGLGNSNKILSNIQKGLKDLVGEVHPPIKSALEKASANIDKAEEFTRNLIGRDAISGEAKLKQIANSLKDPASRGEQLKLLQELKQFTGHDVLPELKGYVDYLQLLSKNFPTKTGIYAKSIGKRLLQAGAGLGIGAESKRIITGGGL